MLKKLFFDRINYLIYLFKVLFIIENFPVVFSIIFGKPKRDIKVRLKNSLTFYVENNSDLYTLFEVYSKKDYDININSKSNIIDIGAHIGSVSIFFANKYPSSTIYSYEPERHVFRKMVKNIQLNKMKNIKIFQLAVTNRSDEEVFIYKTDIPTMSSIYNLDNGSVKDKEIVKTISLEDIVKRNDLKRIDLLKMDCEGCEYEILFNLDKTTIKIIQNVIIEYHNGINDHSEEDLEEFLVENGFEVRLKRNHVIPNVGLIYATRKNFKEIFDL